MRDGRLEDQLRTVLRGEGDALPLTITTAELERRLSLRRRERLGRRASVLAAAVAVIAIGALVATTGGWFRTAGVGSGPSPIPTGSPMSSGAVIACETIDPAAMDEPPSLILSTVPGDGVEYSGAPGPYELGDRQVGQAGGWVGTLINDAASWDPVPAGSPTVQLQASGIAARVCLVGLTAVAVPFDDQSGQLSTEMSLAALTSDPTGLLEFPKPPVGDWLVRVRAEFATGNRGPAWRETFFRVLVPDPSATPPPSPSTLPEIPAPKGTVLVENASASVPGEPTGATKILGLAPVPPRGDYRVDVVCLGPGPLRWSLGREGGLEGDFGIVAAGDQVCDGTLGSQTLELGIPPRDVPIFVEADPATAWHIVVSSIGEPPRFLPPSLLGWWNEEAGATLREAFGHCVSSSFGSDQCGPNWETAAAAAPIHIAVAGENSVGFKLEDGWDIANARVTAVAAGTTAPEYSVAFIDEASREIRVPIELDPGQWIVQVSLNAKRGSEAFGAWYNVPVDVVVDADE